MNRCRPVVVAAACVLVGTAACGGGGPSTAPNRVTASDSTCEVERTRLDGGRTTFEVENVGSKATEVYVYGRADDGFTKVIGEKENIGPGTSQKFAVDLSAGKYQVACKPGMTGDGIRTDLTVAGGSTSDGGEAAYDREIRLQLKSNGTVTRLKDTDVRLGERIEFQLENTSGSEHFLEVFDPDGTRIGRTEAGPGEAGEIVAGFDTMGRYQLRIFPEGNEAGATLVNLRVVQ
jgi:iron uptake system component EfeO